MPAEGNDVIRLNGVLFPRKGNLPSQRKLVAHELLVVVQVPPVVVQEPPKTTAVGNVEQGNGGVLHARRMPQEAQVGHALELGDAIERHRPEVRVDGIGTHIVGGDTDGQILALRALDSVTADQRKPAPVLFDPEVAFDLPAEACAFHQKAAASRPISRFKQHRIGSSVLDFVDFVDFDIASVALFPRCPIIGIMSPLELFHPSVRAWFRGRFAAPTDVQARTWPRIAQGAHVLATAPTGSGKTLTAFLWSLDRFASRDYQPGRTRVLYVSPLKALNNDIRHNLLEPLRQLREDHGFPEIRVQTRSGDTSQGDRQRMLRHPPEILITTPESLALLLTTSRGRRALSTVETLILDEVHAIVANRRGVQLMTSVERLACLAGEFQRIALSATVKPLDSVAAYIGGYRLDGSHRPVETVTGHEDKAIHFRVRFPEDARNAAANGKKIWEPLADSFRGLIEDNRSTLFFTNSRRLAEKMTLKINEDQLAPLAYAHHGSLARDIRTEVEKRLRAGELGAIVATSSLELGIDIGELDEVVLVQSPPSVAAALQRIGRAGHRVGQVSKGTLYPTHAQDFLEAAVLADAVADRDIEPLTPLTNSLDVLCQTIVSMCATETWGVDELFSVIRASSPYHGLPKEQFDLVLDMLAGRYAGSRVRELKPRIAYDRIDGTVRANKSALFALYNSGGTIPDRGYYLLRHADSGTLIGELDEEFVWEASVGQTFNLGTQNWQIQRITHNEVLVRTGPPGSTSLPFWRAESFNRSFHFSSRIADYLERADQALAAGEEDQLQAALTGEAGFDPIAAAELIDYLKRQREFTNAPLPHRHHLLLELMRAGPGGYRGPDAPRQLVIHTFWGGAVNRPWALALEAAWRDRFDSVPDVHADNNAVVVQLKQDLDPEDLLDMVTPDNLDALLRLSLEGSGYFGARFRECAGRALLLTRQRFNQRLPLWMSRMQAKKLMTATKKYTDFPVLLEAWRTCLVDEFDLPALRKLLGELQEGGIERSLVETIAPSPFASAVTFDQLSRYMYADDRAEDAGISALGGDLIENAVNDQRLRPRLRMDVIEAFEAKRQRRAEGYQPQSTEDWLEWAKERVLIPASEWPADVDHERLVRFEAGGRSWIGHLETAKALVDTGLCADSATGRDSFPDTGDNRTAEELARETLSFYGPRTLAQIETILPQIPEDLFDDSGAIIRGKLVEGSEALHFCDADNLQSLLRFQRAANRVDFTAKPLRALPEFWAAWQGFGQPWSESGTAAIIERLSGYAAPAQAWLHDFMACRFTDFADHLLDELFTREQFCWLGTGNRRITLCYPEDTRLYQDETTANTRTAVEALFTDRTASYSFHQLHDRATGDTHLPHERDTHPSGDTHLPRLGDTHPLGTHPSRDTHLPASGDTHRSGPGDTHLPHERDTHPSSGQTQDFSDGWWDTVWQGAVTADSLAPLRAGLRRDFRLDAPASRSPRRRARAVAQGWPGHWRLTDAFRPANDPLEQLEDDKDRVRGLAERYGFLNREIVNREARWGRLFKAVRVMELAGELIAGHFFKGLSGPQFITPRAFHRLGNHHSPQSFWMNAIDPAAPCGLSVDWPELPRRLPGNYLSFIDGELALVIENNGARLTFHLPPDHPDIDVVVAPLQYLARNRRRIAVDTINGSNAKRSPYLDCLDRTLTRVTDHKRVYLEPR